jgi:hypothetical protein
MDGEKVTIKVTGYEAEELLKYLMNLHNRLCHLKDVADQLHSMLLDGTFVERTATDEDEELRYTLAAVLTDSLEAMADEVDIRFGMKFAWSQPFFDWDKLWRIAHPHKPARTKKAEDEQ